METFLVNGKDFTDLILSGGYNFYEEDLHAAGSGRNPLDGLMEFVIIAEKIHIEITIRSGISSERIAEFMSEIKSHGRVNQYTAFNTISNKMVTFTGMINQRRISLIERSVKSGVRLAQFPMNIVEM